MKLVVLTLETIRLEMKMPLLKGSNQLFKFFVAVGNFCNCKNVLQERLISFEG